MSIPLKRTKLPPAYNGTPENLKGTILAVGEVQGTKYIPGHTGAPIPDTWDNGTPRMQVALYLVGASGSVVRVFVKYSAREGTPWQVWAKALEDLGVDDFEKAIGYTFLLNCKVTYKPDGSVAFREWTIVNSAGEDFRPAIKDEWKDLPTGILEPFYYPGFSPREIEAKRNAVAVPPTVAAAPAVAAPAVAAPAVAAPAPDYETELDDGLPF